ncbi:class I SAM-dependent methyltransferase [Acinetobacter colistiniresistens]|uniref:class I SAM-dependent methyltransferase n=1 Tax=Acinetobacter TaxID=469 RepID=UPI000ABB04BD|nr:MULTISPECIES: class I SAM-dependent methyltransferase [Acinetobacter]UUM27375.1 class I SAM-dependent methyltransferase [Acinetobacter colistiniresistens]
MDKQAQEQQSWSRSVSHELITVALQGDWEVHIIPRPLAKAWLGEIVGKNILCLASAGGQQAPVLAAAGANVTVFDLSDQQLQQDRMVAEREGLHLKTVQGNMCDLHAFHNAEFDLIIQPISNL